MNIGIEMKIPEIIYIEITISGDNKENVFRAGRDLQNYLEGLFDNGRFTIKEVSFYPYIIKFGCPTTENVKVMAETVERIVKGFLEGEKEENGQD